MTHKHIKFKLPRELEKYIKECPAPRIVARRKKDKKNEVLAQLLLDYMWKEDSKRLCDDLIKIMYSRPV